MKIFKVVCKVLLAIILLSLLFTHLAACASKQTDDMQTTSEIEGDGRNGITRGMSPQEVTACKGKKGRMVGEALFYKNDVLPCIKDVVIPNYKCRSGYLFSGEALELETYTMETKNMKKVIPHDDYYEIRDILSMQYGEPEDGDIISKADLEEPDDLRFDNKLITEWLTEDRTWVKLELTYRSDKSKIEISYY